MTKSQALTIIVLQALLLLATVIGTGILWQANREPSCPTEDSCTIDYRNGQWEITEDTP